MSAPLTKDQAFALCMEMQAAFFGLADSLHARKDKETLRDYAVKAGQVAGFIIPGNAPGGDAANDGDAA